MSLMKITGEIKGKTHLGCADLKVQQNRNGWDAHAIGLPN